jgi:N-acetylglucosaminyldiphosphoundecaprenol N-acetyl-beta-D-mannosaminyltransferase
MRSTRLLGLDYAGFDAPSAAAWLARRPADAPFAYVVTPNADHVVRLARQPSLATLYADALLRLLDSRVMALTAGALGLPKPIVATGSDLTAHLLRDHLYPSERVTIVGLKPALLSELVERCQIAPPAHYDPPMGFDRDPAALQTAVDFVLANPARFTFLAVGSPRQERLAAAIRATGRATGIGLCIGASLEFLAGASQRAPQWMRRTGCEWLHRLASDPRRLARRYLFDDPPIFALMLREWFRTATQATA